MDAFFLLPSWIVGVGQHYLYILWLGLHLFYFGQRWSECCLYTFCNMLLIYYRANVLFTFLLEVEGSSQPRNKKLIIPLWYPYFAGKIGCYIENNFALEWLLFGAEYVLSWFYLGYSCWAKIHYCGEYFVYVT